jgi:hypothetical protein
LRYVRFGFHSPATLCCGGLVERHCHDLGRHEAMNIRRGMFRLWGVLSGFYIAVVAIALGSDLVSEFSKPSDLQFEVRSEGQTYKIMAPSQAAATERIRSLQFNGSFPPPPPGWVLDDPTEPRPWHMALTASIIAFAPPAILFVFGSALAWAFSGFKTTTREVR